MRNSIYNWRVCVAILIAGILQNLYSQGVPCRVDIEHEGDTYYMDCWSTHDITKSHPNLDRFVLVQHGATRTLASVNFNNTIVAAEMGGNTTSLIFAPQMHYDDEDGPDEFALYWPSGWRGGANSTNGPEISNFAVWDSLIERVTDLNPNIKTVVITGHSAGGQTNSRYAALTPITESLYERKGVEMVFIVSNPSTYLYFNEERWIEGTEYEFEEPDTDCNDYDDYHYGLGSDLNDYASYLDKDSILRQFSQRNVHLLMGTDDIGSSQLSNDCGAKLQGENRFERGKIYNAYLGHFFGDEIYQTHKMGWAVGIGHTNEGMYQSDCGIYFTFGAGECIDPEPVVKAGGWRMTRNNLFARQQGSVIRYQIPSPGNYRLSIYSLKGSTKVDDIRWLTPEDNGYFSLEQLGLSPSRYTIQLEPR